MVVRKRCFMIRCFLRYDALYCGYGKNFLSRWARLFFGGGILLLGCGEGGMWISLGSVGALIVGLEGRHRRGSIFVS